MKLSFFVKNLLFDLVENKSKYFGNPVFFNYFGRMLFFISLQIIICKGNFCLSASSR